MTAPDAQGRHQVVGVLCPMKAELQPFVRHARLHAEPAPHVTGLLEPRLWRGRAGGTEIVAVRGGVGPKVATRVTEAFLDAVPVDQMVVLGVAGGLDPALGIGDLVVPEVVADRASGAEYRTTSIVPTGGGKVVTSVTAMTDPADAAEWLRRGYSAVDMESSAVAAVCVRRGVPVTVVRAISDRPDDGIVDDEIAKLAREDGSPDVAGAIRLLVRQPGRLRHLPGLVRAMRVATTAASRAVRTACVNLPHRPPGP